MGIRVAHGPTLIDAVVVRHDLISGAARTPCTGTVGHSRCVLHTLHHGVLSFTKDLIEPSLIDYAYDHGLSTKVTVLDLEGLGHFSHFFLSVTTTLAGRSDKVKSIWLQFDNVS